MDDFPQHFTKLIERACETEGIFSWKTKIESGSTKGDGYASKMYRITVKGTDGNGAERTLNLALKTAPTGEKYRALFKVDIIFTREFFMYEKVLPEFQKLQDEANIAPQDQFKYYCKYYGGSMKYLEESIMMENMKENSFDLWNRRKAMPYEVVKKVMQCFGQYHALSFALRDKKPELFKELSDATPDVLIPMLKEFNFSPMITKNINETLDGLDPIKDHLVFERLTKLRDIAFETLETIVTEASGGKYSVIGHGDSWCNNMMFKFEDSSLPTDMRLLDWQLSRFASPVLDLSYFLMPNLTNASNRVDELLQEYYKSLSTFLRQLGCDPDKLYPHETLKSHWKQYCVYGLLWATVLANVMCVDPDEAPDMELIAENDADINDAFSNLKGNREDYKSIMKAALYYCLDNNFI